jgi:DNA (cytosine-5)-methyltransferase 1
MPVQSKFDQPIGEPNKYKAISLFSGLGGDTLGLTNANVDVVAYNELDKIFCKSHEENFPNSVLLHDDGVNDITKLPDEIFEKYKDNVDIIFAGFPCQSFSNAGKKQANDPRGQLFKEFLRAAKIIEPTMIIGENVKGLLSRKTTSGEPYIDVIVKEFENIGYNVEYKVLKVNEYGVPQKRERLIIIGTKEGNSYKWTSKFPEPCKEQPNLKNIIKYDMTDAIRVDPNLFNGIPEECIITNMRDKKEYEEDNGAHPYLKRLYNADENLRTYQEKTHDNLFSFGKRISPIHAEIIDIRGPAKTIICTYNHQPRFFVPIKNKSGTYLRTILPDELKQIQGFPADYKIAGNNKQQIVQVGNAVPPPLIEKIVKNIIGE